MLGGCGWAMSLLKGIVEKGEHEFVTCLVGEDGGIPTDYAAYVLNTTLDGAVLLAGSLRAHQQGGRAPRRPGACQRASGHSAGTWP